MATPSRTRAPFAAKTSKSTKKTSGATAASATPLHVRVLSPSVHISDSQRAELRARIGRQLGKYALRIERVSVRITDVNGPRGGVDIECRIKVTLSGLDSVVGQATERTVSEAFARALRATEQGVRRAIERRRR